MAARVRRYYRTVMLGVLAMAALVWVAMDQFGLSRRDMLELLLTTLAVAAGVIVCAAVAVLLWAGLRRLGKKVDRGPRG